MRVETQLSIAASRAAVWHTITDIEHAAEVMSGIEAIEIVERPPQGLIGLRWRETRMYFGKPATVEKRITQATEGTSFTAQAEGDGFVFLSSKRIEERDGGVVLVEAHESQPQGFVARVQAIVMSLFFAGVIRKAIMQDLQDVKRAAEEQ